MKAWPTLLCLALALGVATDASAWERKSSLTGARGTATTTASGTVAKGAATRDVQRVGPAGRSVSSDAQVVCLDKACTRTKTVTGASGGSVTSTGSASCTGSGCSRTTTVGGSNGRGLTRESSVTRN